MADNSFPLLYKQFFVIFVGMERCFPYQKVQLDEPKADLNMNIKYYSILCAYIRIYKIFFQHSGCWSSL